MEMLVKTVTHIFLALNIGFSLSLDYLLLLIYNLSPFTEGGTLAYGFYP